MTHPLAQGFWISLVACCAPALAGTPELAVYVTDADEDVYVALYGRAAVELAACAGPGEAKALLQLPAAAPVAETTLVRLVSEFNLGAHPRIPCQPGARFDADWPATAPIWADLLASGNYFLPAPSGGGAFYGIPARCKEIKAALAIRERLQLPGVLQEQAAPPALNLALLLDCGAAEDGGGGPGEPALPTTSLSLHRFETFLSAESSGESILVARAQPTDGAPPVYLPIWRVDGVAVSATLLAGGPPAAALQAALAELFDLGPNAPVTPLGAEAVAAVRMAPHVDLCLAQCDGYVHRHAAFLDPAVDFGLTEIAGGATTRRLTRLGDEQFVWNYAGAREAVFTACERVAAALGLQAPAATDWSKSIEASLLAEPKSDNAFACPAAAAQTCVRRIADGATLTAAAFAPGADCAAARRLRVELPAAVSLAGPPQLSGGDFQSIELAPKAGVARSIVTGKPGPPTAVTSSCFPSTTRALLFADRLPHLVLRRLGLHSAVGAAGEEVVGLAVEHGSLVLDGTELGGAADATQPLARGVTLCQADLYAADSAIRASALGVQGVSARILVAGTAAAPSLIAEPRFGLLASAESILRLHHARISARTPLVLRGGSAVASRTELSPGADAANDAAAVQLERGAAATFSTSTAGGFRCVATFADAGSSAAFVLPGNDLARDNTHLACGAPGRFTLLE